MNGEYRLDFQWPRASKYELRPATAEEVERCHAEPLSNDPRLSMDMPERALFPNVPEADLPMYFGHIVPIGRAAYHRPRAEAMDYAVRALVECKETPLHRVALTAARALGTLSDLYGDSLPDEDDEHVRSTRILEEAGISLPDPRSDQVCDWYWMAHHLRLIFRGKWFNDSCEEFNWPDDPETYTVGELAVLLVPDKNNKPVLAVRPDSLTAALVFTAARMKATGTTFDICEHCRSPFLSGGIRYRAKRGDAKFCSDPCRYSYHNEQRRRAKGE